ncbi:MAG: hypothetical protein ACYC5F_02255 [Thermoleophilia bacterium]
MEKTNGCVLWELLDFIIHHQADAKTDMAVKDLRSCGFFSSRALITVPASQRNDPPQLATDGGHECLTKEGLVTFWLIVSVLELHLHFLGI